MQSRTDETLKNEKFNIMINFDKVTVENTQERNPRWSKISNHPYRILIAGSPRLGETISLLNLIDHQSAFDKIY